MRATLWPAPPPRACAASGPARRAARRSEPRPGPDWRITALAPTTSRVRTSGSGAADASAPGLAAGGMLPRCQAAESREVETSGEHGWIDARRLIAVTGQIPCALSCRRLIGCASCGLLIGVECGDLGVEMGVLLPEPREDGLGHGRIAASAATAASSAVPGSCPAPDQPVLRGMAAQRGDSSVASPLAHLQQHALRLGLADFTATSAIRGRAAASAMASASMRSFLPRRTSA